MKVATNEAGTLHWSEETLRAQRAETIGLLASGIAHDLNNVLTPIAMAAGALNVSWLEPEQRHFVDVIASSSERAKHLVRQILDVISGTESEPTVVDVAEVIGDLAKLVKRTFPKSIDVVVEVSPDPLHVLIDQGQLRQALLNLLVNARDAMAAGGVVSIRAEHRRRAVLNLLPDHCDDVVVTVTDTGSGMPAEVLEQVFDPFFTTKSESGGSGLGLPSCRSIIERHGGTIDVRSTSQVGTSFMVRLPWVSTDSAGTAMGSLDARASPAAATADADTDDSMTRTVSTNVTTSVRGGTVLVVDDERLVVELAAHVLEAAGYEVVRALDGFEALRLAQEVASLDVAVVDLSMPGLDGPAAIAQVQRTVPSIRIVVMSGLVSPAHRAALASAGVCAELSKPFDADELLAAVDLAMRSR